ncbi:MAG: LacI family transcriptional regulator [Firmicutes bacterium]|nr:LacI family transcriptional regulator [Bacillota bacterium]
MTKRTNDNGTERITMTDIAKMAGVSVATVSRVINDSPGVSDENRKRISKLIEELGYQPNFTARNLVRQSTRTIAVINMQTLGQLHAQPASGRMLQGIESVLTSNGYRCTILSRDEFAQDMSELRLIKGGSVDGILLNGAKLNDPLALELTQRNFPFVIIGRAIGLVNSHYVDIDNVFGAYSAVESLVRLGHRRIAHVCGSQQTNLGVERLEGYRRALLEAGLAYNESLVIDAGLTRKEVYTSVRRFFENIAQEERPTAVFTFNDFFAIPVIRALLDLGLQVPRDVSVIGFDDDEASQYLNPPLASVRAPISEMGMKAAEMLLKLIQGKQIDSRQVILQTRVIERDSLGSPSPPA